MLLISGPLTVVSITDTCQEYLPESLQPIKIASLLDLPDSGICIFKPFQFNQDRNPAPLSRQKENVRESFTGRKFTDKMAVFFQELL